MDGKQIISIVLISVVLVLLLRNSTSTSNVINALASGFATDVSVLQGSSVGGVTGSTAPITSGGSTINSLPSSASYVPGFTAGTFTGFGMGGNLGLGF